MYMYKNTQPCTVKAMTKRKHGAAKAPKAQQETMKPTNPTSNQNHDQSHAANGSLDPRTVFVRNVPYTMDTSALEQLFATDVGPVRSAFLVNHKGAQHHAGYGYVQFALQQDAAQAVQAFLGKRVQGRLLQVMPAARRAPLEERKRKRDTTTNTDTLSTKPPRPPKQPRTDTALNAQQAAVLLRTIAVAAPTPIDAPMLTRIRTLLKPLSIVSITDPAPADTIARCKLTQDGAGQHIVLLELDSVKAALEAVPKLHRVRVSSGGGGGGGKKGAAQDTQGDSSGGVFWARQLGGEALHRKKWRLIVRNLPFGVTEQQLLKVVNKVAFVWEVTLPRNEQGKPRGFAFLGFMIRGHAQRAIDTLNGTHVGGRPIAVDWAVSKHTHHAEEGGGGGGGDVDGVEDDDDDDDDVTDDGHSSDEEGDAGGFDRETQGVDKVESGGKGMRSIVHELLKNKGDVSSDEEGEEGEDGEGSGDEEEVDVEEEEEEEEDVAQHSGGEEAQATITPAADNTPSTTTVFVRGLPLDATQRLLLQRLGVFGHITSCRLVRDKAAGGQLKGTAFVEYGSAEAAQRAVDASAKASAGTGPAITVAGRMVSVHTALSGQQARELASSMDGNKQDRRRLYLAKEGSIPEGSPAWADMSKGDQLKRKRAAAESKAKLKSPNFVVSDTRLSVRNLPRSLDEKALKQLFLQAVKARAPKASPIVRQAKVLRDTDRTTADGSQRSKGIGFVEFAQHEHALVALRQLNNNPDVFGRERRPIVEFAIDNVKALKARESKAAARRVHQEKKKSTQQQQGNTQPQGNSAAAPVDGDENNKPQKKKQRKPRPSKKRKAEEQHDTAPPKETTPHPAKAKAAAVAPVSKAAGVVAPVAKAAPPATTPAEAAPAAKKRKKRPFPAKGGEREDALDDMVARYKAAMFGGGAGGAGKKQEAGGTRVRKIKQRWFE